MADAKTNDLMERLVALCKRRGFIFQSSEIYGGINGFWDYGPLGAELKRNIKESWWQTMTRWRDDVVGLEATIIMHPKIWQASGHATTFADPMTDCLLTKKRFRADQIEPQSGAVYHFDGAESKETGFKVARPFAVLIKKGDPPDRARKVARQFYAQASPDGPLQRAGDLALLNETTEEVENSTRYNPENGSLLTEPRQFNLMFKTCVGPVETEENMAWLRPETAQAIFAQFKNVLEVSRQQIPFGICQIGKAFRNEINPRNFTFRSREFEQMELEFFIRPDEAVEAICGRVAQPAGPGHPGPPQPDWGWQLWHQYWVEERLRFYEHIGLPRASLVEYWQKPEELAHYARATVDILYKFPFSKRDAGGELMGEELEGIAARSDFDLSQHQRFSGKAMGVYDEELRTAWTKLAEAKKSELSDRFFQARFKYLTKMGEPAPGAERLARADAANLAKGNYLPHVIEPSAGVDRLALALLSNAYCEDQAPDEKGKLEPRLVMRFHPRIAPVKVAVFPLLKNKPELVRKALQVRDLLRPHMAVFYDEAGAIGRRYRRQDEAGTPFGVTIDFETLGEQGPELKDTVTLRDRDTMKQQRVKINELLPMLLEKIT
ncbi:MAG: glycine--tRNA ligase [Verrucomicrobiota bacterium]|jgi:glycyl-tRNA synthetase